MKYTLLTIVTLTALAGSAGTTYAQYLSPEEVLYGEINSRRAAEIVERREAERIQKLKESAPEPEEPETVEPELPEETPETPDNFVIPDETDSGQYFFLDAETARLLERLGSKGDGDPNILHPGAPLDTGTDYPLAPTGPGTVALAVTLIGALGWTGYRVWRTERIG